MQDHAADPAPPGTTIVAPAASAAAVGLLLGVALAMGGRLWFFSDDWNVLADYHDGRLLEPFNGHLSAVPAGIYQVLFHTVGLGSYLPYRLCGLVALGVLGLQVARYASARVPPVVAVLCVVAVMWSSSGATNVLFPFLMNFSIPIAAMVAIWRHLDRETLGHDLAAGAWLAVALATSGLGVMTLAAVVVELGIRRAPWQRWAAFAPAALAWLAWWLGHREANDISRDLPAVAEYAVRMLWGGTTALAAGNRLGGLAVGAAFVALVVVALRRGSFGARSAGALAAAMAFVGLTALTRLDVVPSIPPDELRYGWTIGAFLVLAAVSMWPPRRTDERSSPGWLAVSGAIVVAVVLAIGGWRLVQGMDHWADQVAASAPGLRSVLYATEAAGAERVDPSVVLPLSYVPVTAGAYLDAVADVGSPLEGATLEEIGGRTDQREAAERVFFDSVELRVASPSTSVGSPSADCAPSAEVEPGAELAVVPGPGRATGEAELSVGRFAATPTQQFGAEGAARWVLVLPRDAPVGTDAVVPYRLRADDAHLLCPP
jgi:hypothetical protein